MADRAVLFGINNYQSVSSLRGCENDVKNMARLLSENYGFEPANIHQYLSQDVIRQNVSEGMNWLLDGSKAGDRLVFHFAGHGSYIESVDSDEVIDELICLYDMDFDDPNTYLLDDDLGRFTAKVRLGVRLTVILDTCHSGTGTRQLSVSRSNLQRTPRLIESDTARKINHLDNREAEHRLNRGDTDLIQSLEGDMSQVVLARVIERSQVLQRKKDRVTVRRFGASISTTRSGTMNHQLLAAAKDSQTAADAFIDGEFHGAFTYHLCQTARRLGASISTDQVMTTTQEAIQNGGFFQIPQNEGPYGKDILFGPSSTSITPEVDPPRILPEHTTSAMSPSSMELLIQMLRVAEKYIDFAGRLLEMDSGRTELMSRAANEFVVYVHGIGQHKAEYSHPWLDAMQPHLTQAVERREVLWSQVVNPRGLRSLPNLSADEKAFADSIEMVLQERSKVLLTTLPDETRRAALTQQRSDRGLGFSVDDFARYMTNQAVREEILDIFDAQVRPLLQVGATVHLISHSWGSVVAWEGLRRLGGLALAGRIENLFLVGSPLSIGIVQSNLFSRIGDGRRPQVVSKIINLDARGDLVGGPIGGALAVDQEFLNLQAAGCSSIPIVGLSCAHNSYFQPGNIAVNRDIFAKYVNE